MKNRKFKSIPIHKMKQVVDICNPVLKEYPKIQVLHGKDFPVDLK